MAHVTDFSTGTVFLTSRFAALRSTMAARSAQNKVFNATFNELNALSDRDLWDLGIARSDIRSIAREAAYK